LGRGSFVVSQFDFIHFLIKKHSLIGISSTFLLHQISVSILKQTIATKCQIPAEKQVLLVSGGESLEDDCRVSQYSAAGTDTNPIFLFHKCRLEQQQLFSQWQQQQAAQQQMQYQQLQAQIKRFKQQIADRTLPPSYEAVVRRTETAKELHQLAREIHYNCECLLRDQHLQYQGWAAVIANLEDIAFAFRESAHRLNGNFTAYLSRRSRYLQLLSK
jgi:RB1-inducible coiled-coil protein 1